MSLTCNWRNLLMNFRLYFAFAIKHGAIMPKLHCRKTASGENIKKPWPNQIVQLRMFQGWGAGIGIGLRLLQRTFI